MKLLFIKLLIIILLVNSCNSELFTINADKCTNLGCTFTSLFTSKLPKITDDVIFITSNPLIQSIIILSDQISINSLNVTNGILKIASSGSLSVTSNILIAAGGSLMLDGISTCNSLTVNGNLYVNAQSSLSVAGSLKISSGIFESNGTLNIGALNIDASVQTLPKIFGNAVVTLKGDANINAGIQLLDSASLIVNTGICTIKNIVASSTSTIENRATLLLSNVIGDLVCKVNSIAGSIIKFQNSKIHFHNILSTDTTSINLLGSTITIHNTPTISLGVLSIDSTSNIILDKTTCTIASLKSSAIGSIIKLTNSSNFNIDKSFDLNCDLDIDPTSAINVMGSTNQVINFFGNIVSAVNSIIKLDNTCIFNKEVTLDSILLGPNSVISFIKNSKIIKDLECPSTAKIIIDKVAGSLTIGGNSNIDININLDGAAKLNIVASITNPTKACTIKQITTGVNSILNIGAGVNLNILNPSTFGSSIQLNGNSILQLNGNVTLNGLTVFPINNINLPTLILSDSHCILPENVDFDIMGTIKLIKSTLELSNNIIFNINNNLNCDPNSNVIIPVDATLIVAGPSSIIESKINIDGKLNFEKGSIKLNGGIASTINSFITCNNANVEINGNNNDIDGQISLTGTGSININSLTTNFKKGIKCPTFKTPININAKASVSISADSLISSPIFCLGNSALNILASSNIQLDGGINTEIDSIISLDNASTLSLNSTSNILGSIKLVDGSTIISSGECKISNSITSDPNSINNLMINGGSCIINTVKNIDISGEINVLKDSILNIVKSNKTTCNKGIKNSGTVILSSVLDTGSSIISQISGDAELVLLKGSNIISKTTASLLSGKISGNGLITTNNCQCGGIINGMISIDGNLNLLDSAVVLVDIVSNSNYSKISCNGNINVNGLIEVNLDASATLTLKKGDLFSIIDLTNTSASINGTLSLSDTQNSKSFTCEKSQTGATYYLIYQAEPLNSSKNEESDEDHASSSTKLYNSITLLIISIILMIIY